jgi:heat shock protein HslJ
MACAKQPGGSDYNALVILNEVNESQGGDDKYDNNHPISPIPFTMLRVTGRGRQQMRLKLFLVTLLLFSSLLTGACAGTTCNSAEWQDILWTLKSYGPVDNLQNVLGNADITLQFNSSDRQINGSSGCNHYFGAYTVNSDCELQISGLGATEMACADSALMQQEQKYFRLLVNTGKIELKDGELRITCKNDLLVYTQ